MLDQASENRDSSVEYPEKVYINLSDNVLPIAVTLPNGFIDLPENPTKEPIGDMSLVLQNNGRYQSSKTDNYSILAATKCFMSTEASRVLELYLKESLKRKVSEISRDDFIRIIEEVFIHGDPSGETWENIKVIIERLLKEEGELSFSSEDARPEIIGAIYEREFIPFAELPKLKDRIDANFELCKEIGPQEGDFLYRAINIQEWQEIVRNKGFIIRLATQFEDQRMYDGENSQVKHFSKQEEYSGKIIRFKVVGPYFMYKGIQVPRVESICAHYTEVEVLEDGNWTELV